MATIRDGMSAPNGGTATLRVVVGEDNYLTGEGIARVIEHAPGLELVATRGDLQSLLAVIAEERPDVVLTDIRMPPTKTDEGIVLAKELRVSAPEVGVVVLSNDNEPVYATALFEAGSERRAYLLKSRIRGARELHPGIPGGAGRRVLRQ